MKNKTNLKAIVLSLGLAAAMLPVQAQGVLGNPFDDYYEEKEQESSQGGGVLLRGTYGISENTNEGGISNYGIGEPVPMGSGIAILLAAGLGYVALKKKED